MSNKAEKLKIPAGSVISRSKGQIKYYGADGAIHAIKAKEAEVIGDGEEGSETDTGPVLEVTLNGSEGPADAESGSEEVSSDDGTEAPQAPSSPKKRGGKKGAEKVATKAKGGKKKAVVKKASNGALIRTVAGREHDISGYEKVKNASGHTSYDNGDNVATMLRGKTLDDVYALAAKKLKEEEKALRSKYKDLNPGMQRMALGNRLRKSANPKAA
jgi:hypothetical protein